jgi:molybdopterin-guanine dinucleotide biosynthesis protein A
MNDDVVAIVPAGGRSRRLAGIVPAGGKAAVSLRGESLLGHVCRTLSGHTGRVIVVAAAKQPLPPLPVPVEVVRDRQPDRGPLAAIHHGLAHALAAKPPPQIAVVVSCDVPNLAAEVVRLLIERACALGNAWVVPRVGGHPQVLVSALATSLAGRIAAGLAAGIQSPRRLLDAMVAADPESVAWLSDTELARVDPTLASFADIDTPADLGRLEQGEIPPS